MLVKGKKRLRMIIIKQFIHRFHKEPKMIPSLKANGKATGKCLFFVCVFIFFFYKSEIKTKRTKYNCSTPQRC